jgi:hypothetical protein
MMNNRTEFRCHRCRKVHEFSGRIGRRDSCPQCDADLHCCLNCRHYQPSAHNQCNETQAEWVRDKDRANYCDYFEPRRGEATGGSRAEDARSRFEDLFKK